jgi:hypothetical protein
MFSMILALGLLLHPALVWAESFRCPNNSLVDTGDKIGEVRIKCDSPTSQTTRHETIPTKAKDSSPTIIEVEEWTYNQGRDKFVYTLVFRNGVLSEIHRGGYGK